MQQRGSNSYSYAINGHASQGAFSFLRSGVVVHDFCFLSENSALKTKNLLYVCNRIGDFSLFLDAPWASRPTTASFREGEATSAIFYLLIHSGHASAAILAAIFALVTAS